MIDMGRAAWWAAVMLMATAPAVSAHAVEAPNCFSALRQSGQTRLVCQHKAWMTGDEKADFVKLTRGYLLDATCLVSVDMDRAIIDEAMVASDRVFELPPQPVSCSLTTSGGPMTISGTFAPKVTFKDGFAIDATPGLGNVTGVNSYLAWPVVAYVNSAMRIKGEMAAMINAFRAQSTKRQASR